ncbi:MAG TPA: hypothetical protein DHV68_03480 [Dehalococcoidia bacterium]|nr:hypothetical protein [Chloroflexota bacterium]HCI85885.1 hypothetical protein [Dehalococcoidia bacterium]
MVRKVINRLIGRRYSIDEAINAYVEENASQDELNTVRQMMQNDPVLEKNLSTQQALRDVLGRVDRIESPRSFAITPEMVAAAKRAESGMTRVTELFAPQRKLALAPAIIAGIAALSVALLTIGDVSGLVEQSRADSDEWATTSSSATEATVSDTKLLFNAEMADGAIEDEAFVDVAESVPVTESGRDVPPTATAELAEPLTKASSDTSEIQSEPAPKMEIGAESEPPALAVGEGAPQLQSDADDSMTITMELEEVGSDGASADAVIAESMDGAEVAADSHKQSSDDGIAIPVRELQLALAALTVLSVIAWTGIRRIHSR